MLQHRNQDLRSPLVVRAHVRVDRQERAGVGVIKVNFLSLSLMLRAKTRQTLDPNLMFVGSGRFWPYAKAFV
jgi:hypothetical protein